MGELILLNDRGHDAITWDEREGEAAVAEAQRILDENLKNGSAAFDITEEPATRIKTITPAMEKVIVIPPMVGG